MTSIKKILTGVFAFALFSAPLLSMEQERSDISKKDILVSIFQWLDFPDLIGVYLVSLEWNNSANDEGIWKRLFQIKYPVRSRNIESLTTTWKELFLSHKKREVFSRDVLKLESWSKEKIETLLSDFEIAEQDLILNLESAIVEESEVLKIETPLHMASLYCAYHFCCIESGFITMVQAGRLSSGNAVIPIWNPALQDARIAFNAIKSRPSFLHNFTINQGPWFCSPTGSAVCEAINQAIINLELNQSPESDYKRFALANIYVFAFIAQSNFIIEHLNNYYYKFTNGLEKSPDFAFSTEDIIKNIEEAILPELIGNHFMKSLRAIIMEIASAISNGNRRV